MRRERNKGLHSELRASLHDLADAPNLRQCVDAVHRAAEGMQHGLIEIVKSCIECVCITILNDRGETVPALPSGVDLLRQTLDSLGLQNTRGLSKIDSVVTLNKLAEGIVALRNERGVVGHGKDGFLDGSERDHLRCSFSSVTRSAVFF